MWGGAYLPRRSSFLLRLLGALFSVSLFSLLFLFLFSAFLPQLSFLGFPLLCPRLSFSCALTAFLFRFQVFLFSVAALLGLGARSSAHGSPCRGKTTLAGAAALPMRAALGVRPCAALRGLFFFAPLRVGPAVGGATSPHPISRCDARILGAGRAIETMWMVAPCLGKRSAGLFNKTPGVPPRRQARRISSKTNRAKVGRGETGGAERARGEEKEKGQGEKKRKREEKRKYARRVDVKKKPSEIVAPLSLRLSRCAGSKKSNPDFQRPIERLSFDFSAPPRSASTGESVNAFFRLSQGNKREGKSRAGKNPAERRQEQRGKEKGPDAAPPGVRSGPPS